MIHRNMFILVAVAGALALAGCQATGQKETGGTVLGAAAGGLLGSQVGAGRGQLLGTAFGTLAGAALGAEIGRSLDNADRAMARWNEGNAADSEPAARETRWTNPDGDAVGPTGRRIAEGEHCPAARRAAAEAHHEDARRSRCGRVDGSWQVVN